MKNTYKVVAKSSEIDGIDVEFKGFDYIDDAFECAYTLERAFPDIAIISEQTGELIYSLYLGSEAFTPVEEMGKAIFHAECDRHF